VVTAHDGSMHRVARGQSRVGVGEVFGGEDVLLAHGEDVVHDAPQGVKRHLARLAPVNGPVAMQKLLEDLAAGHQAPTFARQPLEVCRSAAFMAWRAQAETG
jgi:hypothetical protein